MGYKRLAGALGPVGEHCLGPIWVPFGVPFDLGPFGAHVYLFGTHLGPFVFGPNVVPFGPSLLSPFGGAIGNYLKTNLLLDP